MDPSALGLPHLGAVIGELATDPPRADPAELTEHLLDLAVLVVGGMLQI
jgi:hypothetical protein